LDWSITTNESCQISANHDEAERIERRQESLPVRETGAVATSEPLRSSEPLLSSTTAALIMPRGVRR
jgi:hypothetical protein